MNKHNVTIGAKVVGIVNNTKYIGTVIGFETGIVEVMTQDTVLSKSQSRPSYGSEFVRLLKADGTPGMKFDRWFHGWSTKKPEIGK